MTVFYPVLRTSAMEAPFAWGSDILTTQRFVQDVAGLATLLPERPYVVNLCRDRYHFTVALMAAMTRHQITLLPSSEAPVAIEDVLRRYPDAYILHEPSSVPESQAPVFAYPATLPCLPPSDIPAFAHDQEAVVLFTSGSTGNPVPHPRSWGASVLSTRAAADAIGISGLAGGSILGTVPHQHSYGLESIVMLALQHGFALHRQRSLLPADIIAELWHLPEPRILVTTPIHLRGLIAEDGVLPRVARILCATAPLHPGLAALAEERFGAPLYEIYGCSEVGQIATRRTTGTAEWRCLAGIELRQVEDEVWARGDAAAGEAVLNDIVDLRGPDRFYLLGRKSDMINIAGKRSSLSFLNHQLTSIPGVQDGVFVIPEDSDGTARLRAYVVAPDLSARDILAALRQNIDPAFLPRPLHLVDALPRNMLGKLTRNAMESLIVETVER